MTQFIRSHPFDPRFALPKYVRGEPPGRNAIHSFGVQRGTFSERPKGWTGGYAIPKYIMNEFDGRGAVHSYDLPRGTIGARVPNYLGNYSLGATARSIHEAPLVTTAKRGTLATPLIAVGPWAFNPKGSKVTIARGRLKEPNYNLSAAVDPGRHLRFLYQGLNDASIKPCLPTAGNLMNNTVGYCHFDKKYKWWSGEGGPKWSDHPDSVPRGWGHYLLTGKRPIYKVTNPIEGGDWGLYITVLDNSIVVEFKKLPTSWLTWVWNGIKTIVGVIIDTVKALFDFFKGIVACAAAGNALSLASAAATGGLNLLVTNPAVKKQINDAGVSDQEIGALGTNASSAMAVSVGTRIADYLCPNSLPPAGVADQAAPNWLLPVAIGGAAVAIWLLTRKK